MENLGVLAPRADTRAFGLNNAGLVVGQSNYRAFIWKDGTMRDLNDMIPVDCGCLLTDAVEINQAGQILANGFGGPYVLTLVRPF